MRISHTVLQYNIVLQWNTMQFSMSHIMSLMEDKEAVSVSWVSFGGVGLHVCEKLTNVYL